MPASTDPASLPQQDQPKGSRIWIVGLVIFLAGAVLVVLGALAVGKGVVDATQKRLVHTAKLVPGEPFSLSALQVDPEQAVRVGITAEVEVPAELIDKPGAPAKTISFSIPASMKVTDSSGTVIEMSATPLTGSTIVPAADSPHRASFDPLVECRVQTRKFEAPTDGQLGLEVQVNPTSDSGEPVTRASLEVHDQIAQKAAAWGLSGVLFLVGGPATSFLGYFIFGIGIIVVRNRRARARTGGSVEGLQLIALIWGLIAGFGMLIGLIPLLGWTNWMSIPVSFLGLVFSIVAACTSKDPNKSDALIGLTCCLTAAGIGVVRLVLGFGVV